MSVGRLAGTCTMKVTPLTLSEQRKIVARADVVPPFRFRSEPDVSVGSGSQNVTPLQPPIPRDASGVVVVSLLLRSVLLLRVGYDDDVRVAV